MSAMYSIRLAYTLRDALLFVLVSESTVGVNYATTLIVSCSTHAGCASDALQCKHSSDSVEQEQLSANSL